MSKRAWRQPGNNHLKATVSSWLISGNLLVRHQHWMKLRKWTINWSNVAYFCQMLPTLCFRGQWRILHIFCTRWHPWIEWDVSRLICKSGSLWWQGHSDSHETPRTEVYVGLGAVSIPKPPLRMEWTIALEPLRHQLPVWGVCKCVRMGWTIALELFRHQLPVRSMCTWDT